MSLAIKQLMDWRKSLLKSGRLEDLARQFLFPTAIYSAKGTRPLSSPDQLIEALREFTGSFSALELEHLEERVVSIELPSNGRFRIWSDWWVNLPGHPPRLIGKTIHFMRETEQGPLTEMLECLHPLQVRPSRR